MKLLSLLILLSSIGLQAQVGLVIEDQTGQGFYLGINGYLQNAELAKNWHTTQLDTVPFVVQIESDTVDFTKKIHLREKTSHRYVLAYNSRGQLRLRYRGSLSSPKVEAVAWNNELAWPEEWTPRGNNPRVPEDEPTEPAIVAVSNAKPEALEPEQRPALADSISDKDSVVLPGNKVVEIKEETTVPQPPAEPELSAYEELIQTLEKQQFEFDRLSTIQKFLAKNRLTVGELKEVFSIVKYDNTRLQLFDEAYPKLIDPAEADLLISTMEYDISKQKLKEKLDADKE